jgi:hypothetical protein
LAGEAPTPTTEGGWQLILPNRSVTVGSSLIIEANRPLTGVSVQIARVEDHEDMWALSSGLEVDPNQATVGQCSAVGTQPPGLYWITALDVDNGPQMAMTRIPARPPMLFEVRSASDSPRSLAELEAAYAQVTCRRRERRESGIGSGPVAATVLVFVKDLLTTTHLNLVMCEIIPLGSVGWTAEVETVDRLLETRGASPLPWTEEVLVPRPETLAS